MDDFDQVSPEEYQRLMGILKQNAGKSFVKRILAPGDYPTLDVGNGNYATHRMAWTEAGGKYYVYPTVLLQDNGQLKDYGPEKAWDQVRQNGNYIQFDNPQDAEWFSTKYKGAWGGQMNKPPR